MKRVKQIMAGALSGAMLLGCGWMAGTGSAKAAEDAAVSGTVYSIYRAFTENGRDTDPEFGTRSGSLNSSLSPRVIELQYQDNPEDNGKMYATFECNRLPKTDAELVAERQGNGDNISDSLSGFPIYESLDGGATWGGGYTDTSARGDNYVPVGYVQNQGAENEVTGMRNCPQLYEMPETVGDLEKGTILCAGNSIEAGDNGNAADVTQSGITYLDLCISEDLGRTWEHHSSIAGPIEGVCGLLDNTVWEPFFLTFEGRLYCFYSDESIDDTTDQDISYVYYDGEKWSEKQQLIYTRGARPGMPIVSQLEDGRFMLTFELNGGGQSGYILSAPNDPTLWYAADGSLQKTVSQADATVINGSGAPYNITTEDGVILYDNTSLSQIWRNTGSAPDEEGAHWIYYHTGLGSAYNRQIMERSDGRIFVVGGWNGSGISCVTLDYEMDLEKTGSLESRVGYNGASTYLAYNGTPMFTWTGTDGHAEPNQFYEFREAGDGSYVLVSTNNGNAMQVQTGNQGSQVDTAAVDMEDPAQQWVFEEASDGWYYVRNVESGLYLTTPRTGESEIMDNRYLTMEELRENDATQLWKPSIAVNTEEPEEIFHTVTAEAGEGGTISPESAQVKPGESVSFTIQADEGYEITDVLVDGVSVGAVDSWTIENVQADHTIHALFQAADEDQGGSGGEEENTPGTGDEEEGNTPGTGDEEEENTPGTGSEDEGTGPDGSAQEETDPDGAGTGKDDVQGAGIEKNEDSLNDTEQDDIKAVQTGDMTGFALPLAGIILAAGTASAAVVIRNRAEKR